MGAEGDSCHGFTCSLVVIIFKGFNLRQNDSIANDFLFKVLVILPTTVSRSTIIEEWDDESYSINDKRQ